MASFLQSGGSMRSRNKVCDVATQQLKEQKQRKAAVRTRDALDQFEEKLLAEQEAQRALDDLPPEADAFRLNRMMNSGHHSHGNASGDYGTRLRASQTEPTIRQGHLEDPLHSRRPPSPLKFHDYGCISMKPRSLFAQHRVLQGDDVRAKHRQTSCGFYFPGAQMKQGPYGSSLLDPILLPPRNWQSAVSPSLHWQGEPGDVRPLAAEELGRHRKRLDNPVTSSQVRPTKGHAHRAKRLFHCLDKRREESVLEQARFENGVFEASWRDPLLDTPHIEERPPERYHWMSLPVEEMSDVQQEAASLFFRLETVAHKSKGKLAQLFVDQCKGSHPGVLEPHEFIRGLTKMEIIEEGELTQRGVIGVMSIVDPAFDGRISLPVLSRAVDAARNVRMNHEKAAADRRKQQQVKLSTSYSEALPVEVIKVDHPASSLLNFNRSFQKFMQQQKGLLERHNEV